MKTNLLKVSIRQNVIFISKDKIVASKENLTQTTMVLVANLRKLGYTVSEDLLHAMNSMAPNQAITIFDTMKEVLGADLNWAPLVKGWDTPTGETRLDHIITLFANVIKSNRGLRLQCGHLIPENTFPMERYNGCPFCGTPFQLANIETLGQGSKLKVLELWTEGDLTKYFKDLLESGTALDATQVDSLKALVGAFPLPEADITIKETQIVVLDALVEKGEYEKVQQFISTPADILRMVQENRFPANNRA